MDTTVPAEVVQILSPVDLAMKYRWVIINIDMNAAKELGLTGVKKYWRHTGQVEMELNWLHDLILVLAICVRHL